MHHLPFGLNHTHTHTCEGAKGETPSDMTFRVDTLCALWEYLFSRCVAQFEIMGVGFLAMQRPCYELATVPRLSALRDSHPLTVQPCHCLSQRSALSPHVVALRAIDELLCRCLGLVVHPDVVELVLLQASVHGCAPQLPQYS